MDFKIYSMRLSVTSLILLIFTASYSQNGFTSHIVTDKKDGLDLITGIATGDIDGDGFVDVVSTSQRDKTLSWHKNLDGEGTFSHRKIIDNNLLSAFNVFLADVDNDGHLDIICTSSTYEQTKILWYRNLDGLGNFGPRQEIYSRNEDGAQITINIADLDNDGDVDIICTYRATKDVIWFENNNGTFTQHDITTLNYEPMLISAEDVNGDGFMDLVIGSRTGNRLVFYEGDGTGNFSEGRPVSTSVNSIIRYKFADIDNDGDLDVVAIFNNRISWFENLDGNGNFSSQRLILSRLGSSFITIQDVDNDGALDIVVGNSTRDDIGWIKNNDGLGNFGSFQLIDSKYDDPVFLEAVDIDGDGYLDLVSGSIIDQSIDWYKSTPENGSFESRETITGLTRGPYSTDSGDMDGDGLKDIVAADYDGNKIVWFKNIDNQGNFSTQNIISVWENSVKSVQLVDIDRDGDLDILAVTNSDVKWFENDGFGNFSNVHVIEPDNYSLMSAFYVDINGDGFEDIITFASNNGIYWYENLNGTGQFGEKNIVANSTGVITFYPGDINSDGAVDIVLVKYGQEAVWMENDGQGNFGPAVTLFTDFIVGSYVYVGDVNGDGNDDIVLGDVNKLMWYENLDGLGNFGPEQIIEEGDMSAYTILLHDMDSDGMVDVVISEGRSGRVAWYRNEGGQGNFGIRQTIGSGVYFFNVDDIDDDGYPDVIAPQMYQHKITLFKNAMSLGTGRENELKSKTLIYPNPTSHFINIFSTSEIVAIEVFNSLGQRMIQLEKTSKIDISSFNSGFYYVRIKDVEGKVTLKKIIKK